MASRPSRSRPNGWLRTARNRTVRIDPVRGPLVLALIGGASGLAFVSHAANRIVATRPVALWEALGTGWLLALAAGAAVLLAAALRPGRSGHGMAAAAALILLPALLAAAGQAADGLLAGGSPAARVSLGAGFWIALAAAALLLLDGLRRLRAGPMVLGAAASILVASLLLLGWAGWLDGLSIARELAGRRSVFVDAVLRHGALTGLALAGALPLGALLGVVAWRDRRAGQAVFGVLGLLQTIPSLALFALLIEPLTRLVAAMPALGSFGIAGIGMAPAVIALVLYGLLPVARSVESGLSAVSPGAVDAARGMGMTERQLLLRVALPLALPALLGGVRIVVVQLIGLAVVAALIGAGGLGSFVFQGLGQAANDLVLLGALSVIGLALLADGVLRAMRLAVERSLA